MPRPRTNRPLRTLACVLSATIAAPIVAQAPPPGGPGGPMVAERKILKEFDADGNGRLEGAERDAARAELKKTPARGQRGGMAGRGASGGVGGSGGPDGSGRMRAETKPGPKVSPAEVQSYPDAPLFDPSVVRTVFLDFDVPDWEAELELFHNTDADVPATMTVDGRAYRGVGVHFRGASSYMMVPRGTKRSLNIAVDHTDPEARLYGQNTLNFLNANGDASLMSAPLYAHLASPHLATPRANFVQVVVNGESWGVFVNVEQFNKAFLRERWPEFKGEGARWKVKGSPRGTGGLDDRGEGLAAYRERYEIKTKDSEKDWKALVQLCKVLSRTPLDRLEAELAPILDIDGALWFLALDVATANTDGYWIRASDYSLYRDPKGVFHLVPHDMNEAFKLTHGGPPGGMRDGPPGGFDGPPPDPDRGAIRSRGMRPQPGPGPRDAAPKGSSGAVRETDPQDGPRPNERGPEGAAGSLVELDPLVGMDDVTKPLRSRLLAVPALRERYLAHLRAIAAEMEWSQVGPIVARHRAAIADLVAKDTRKATSTEAFERATDPADGDLRRFFDLRSRYILAYKEKASGLPPPSPAASPTGPAREQR